MHEPTDIPEPVQPVAAGGYDRVAEVERLLDEDDSMLGQYWAYTNEGLTPQEMQEREGTASTGWVYAYARMLASLRDGEVPGSPTTAIQSARRIRSWLKKKPLSDQLRSDLETQLAVVETVAEDREAQSAEAEQAVRASEQAEGSGVPGVYVYTLPHYLRYPIDPSTGKTLLKVGHSSVDAYYRAESQGSLTALPEDPILLRIYPAIDSQQIEQQFHGWLRDADHARGRSRRGGREWYVTSTRFLDRIARSLGLEVQVVNEFEAGEE